MRKAYQDYGPIIHEGVYIGVSLGYDFTSEHEWGVDKLKRMLGIPKIDDKNIGIKARSMTVFIEDCFHLCEKGEATILISMSDWMLKDRIEKDIIHKCMDMDHDYADIKSWTKDTMRTAWDGGSFAILGKGEEARSQLKELYQGFKDKKIALAFMGGGVFANASLSFVFIDRLPNEITDQMLCVDTEALDLKKIRDKLDLEGKARAVGMDYNQFHAISPKFIDYGADKKKLAGLKKEWKTKYDVRVWVNGSGEQGYGWFSVEDVLDWIKHKGEKKIKEYKEVTTK